MAGGYQSNFQISAVFPHKLPMRVCSCCMARESGLYCTRGRVDGTRVRLLNWQLDVLVLNWGRACGGERLEDME